MTLSEQDISGLLKKLAPLTPKAKRERFVPFLVDALPRYQIDSAKRIAAFLATCCFESAYFAATAEYADGWAYDKSKNPKKAKELGNTEKGDGPKFKGRGLIQLTGRANYKAFEDALTYLPGLDRAIDLTKVPFLHEDPETVAQPFWAVESACYFWQKHDLNSLADRSAFDAIQGIVNRGSAIKKAKDLDKRQALYTTATAYLNQLTPAPLPSPVETPSPVDGDTSSPPAIFNNDVDAGNIKPQVPEVYDNKSPAWWEHLKGRYASAASYFDSSNQAITQNVARKDAAKSTWALVGGGTKQTLWAILAFFLGIPRELYLTVAIIVGVLTIIYLIRQVYLGGIREKKIV